METRMEFVCHPKFGHLTFCPTNIGTGLRASVHVKVPNTAASGKLDTICAAADLQPRGVNGEHTESVGGVYDISNKIQEIDKDMNKLKQFIGKQIAVNIDESAI